MRLAALSLVGQRDHGPSRSSANGAGLLLALRAAVARTLVLVSAGRLHPSRGL
jgi:hypothetical protein